MNRKDLLIAARERIESGANVYICDALHNARTPDHEGYTTYIQIVDEISEAIDHQFSLTQWLNAQIPGADFTNGHPAMQQARLAWIDKMLENLP